MTHRGKRSIDRLQGAWPNLIVVHTPIHASWLNQAEIYFSVVQRKVVTPNDFADLDTLQAQLLAFGRRYEQIAAPFRWKFTRHDLHKLLAKTDAAPPVALAASYVRELPSQTTKLLPADKRLSAESATAALGEGAAVGVCWGALARACGMFSGGSDGQGVEVVGEDAPSGPGLLAVIAFEAAAVQAVAAFEVADASFGAGAVAL